MVSTRSQKSKQQPCEEDANDRCVDLHGAFITLNVRHKVLTKSIRQLRNRRPPSSGVHQPTISGRVTKSRVSYTVQKTTKTVVEEIETVVRRPARRSGRSLKIKLTRIDFSQLSEAIQQTDYKILRQQKRLENFKGRYYPPMLRQYQNRYHFKFGHNPFQHVDFKGPSAAEQWQVYELMKQDLKENFNKECFLDQPDASTNELQDGPMHMSDDLSIDNLVKVILSISTENSLSIRQHAQLCSKFTYTVHGKEVKGTVPNYHKMRLCSPEQLVKALNVAGHHNIRQKAFTSILQEVYEQNVKRLQPGEVIQEGNIFNAPDFVPGLLSMEYLKGDGLTQQERFDLLVKFEQIAVKTGCCLLAFNLKIPVFVVDTHVHNMVRHLQWIPENCWDADKACMFLDTIMPNRLKFGLHQAFWHHRINCARCMPRANPKSLAYQQRSCPLENFMKRDLVPLTRVYARDEQDKTSSQPSKKANKALTEKKMPGTVAFLNIHHKVATEQGYALRKVVIDDDFGDGARQNLDQKANYYWGLKEFTHANDIVKVEEGLKDIGMTMEEYEARFAKKARAKTTTKKTVAKGTRGATKRRGKVAQEPEMMDTSDDTEVHTADNEEDGDGEEDSAAEDKDDMDSDYME